MIGMKNTIITDDEAVKMHTNFADFPKKVNVYMSDPNNATYYVSDGVVYVKTATSTVGWGCIVVCSIPAEQLQVGKKYGISVTSNIKEPIKLCTLSGSREAKSLGKPVWSNGVGTAIVRIENENISDMTIYYRPYSKGADYVIRDMKIWEIDE